MTTRTEQLASFIVHTDYSSIPEELVSLAKRAIVDYLGVTLAGSKLEQSAELIANYARGMGGEPEAGVIGKGFKVSAPTAALANGTIGHALDFDDAYAIHLGIPAHPSVPILPTVLALGEKYHLSGQRVLASFIIGLEVESRVGSILGQHLVRLGWHTTPIIGSIGSAAATSKILRLNILKTEHALGIASSLAGGLIQNFGTMTKPFHAGCAARNGIAAGLLAEQGFTANEHIFDVPAGFLGAFSGGRELDTTGLTNDLESSWIVSHGIGFKPYPSCRASHCGIDAALYLRSKYQLEADKIAEVTCHASELVCKILSYHQPRTYLEAKFCLEYCVSVALMDGEVSLQHFTSENVSDPRIQRLISKVRMVPAKNEKPGNDLGHELTTRLTVRLDDGREYSHEVVLPKGEPENPMSEEDLASKFRDCANLILSLETTRKCMELVFNLESVRDISEFMEICCGN